MLSYSTQQQWTVSQSDCDLQWTVDFIGQLAITSSVTGPRSSQTCTHTKKGYGHCLVACCHFDPLQLSKSLRNYSIWEGCSTNPWGALKTAQPAASFVNRKGPVLHNAQLMSHNRHFKSWMNLVTKFCLICHILTNQLPLQAAWQLHAGKTLPQPAGGRKCFPRVHWIPKHKLLCYRDKQTYFLLSKMHWLYRFLFWLKKMFLSLLINI